MQPQQPLQSDDIPCKVCQRMGSRNFYKGQVCNACRVFFYRNVVDHQKLECEKKDGNCRVYFTIKRFCIYCRFQKCLKANMKVESVNRRPVGQRPTKLSTPYLTYEAIHEHLTYIYGGMFRDKPENVLKTFGIHNVVEVVRHLADYNRYIFRYGGNSPSWSPLNTDLALSDIFVNAEFCIDKNTAVSDIISKDPMSHYIQYNMPATIVRSVVATIEMLNIADNFRQFSWADKAKMVQRGCTLLQTFVVHYEKYLRRMDEDAFCQYLNRFRATQELPDNFMVDMNQGCYRRLDELFITIQPTEQEMSILRLIGLYQSYPELSLHEINVAIQTKIRMTYLLEQYLIETYPELTRREILDKVHGLLQLVRFMKEIHDANHGSYFRALVDCGFTQTTLGYDLFIRQY